MILQVDRYYYTLDDHFAHISIEDTLGESFIGVVYKNGEEFCVRWTREGITIHAIPLHDAWAHPVPTGFDIVKEFHGDAIAAKMIIKMNGV